jgi:hypothetical protein
LARTGSGLDRVLGTDGIERGVTLHVAISETGERAARIGVGGVHTNIGGGAGEIKPPFLGISHRGDLVTTGGVLASQSKVEMDVPVQRSTSCFAIGLLDVPCSTTNAGGGNSLPRVRVRGRRGKEIGEVGEGGDQKKRKRKKSQLIFTR